ncbi:AMP-dependent synthetase and ligase [Cohnella sp. JJ-181]|uniref:AMP-dependent synthetase and ligase n=1 Tax=Cohnella rhizoplanae TaxID=2974897 RepID=UPI0022FFB6D2|nr:AMP-dependent synthetase and ligase [Cohnella sp. JJ-181]CAI6080597.1 hypothetical protein COHCIP112018_03037 [Cohnella sp. JJ-181]
MNSFNLSSQINQCEHLIQQLVSQTQQASQMYQQMQQQEQQNAARLEELAQREHKAVQMIQQALHGHQTAIQQLQQVGQICRQLEQTVNMQLSQNAIQSQQSNSQFGGGFNSFPQQQQHISPMNGMNRNFQ